MSDALADRVAGGVDDLTASELLATIRSARQVENRAAAEQLLRAAQWADLHPPESIHAAASFSVPSCGQEHEEPIAGEGCPLVAEFCVAELGGVLGVSTVAAKKLIGQALELRHRLPRLWGQVQAGRVPAWKARAVAETTIHSSPALTREAAGFVDAQVAAVAGRVGPAQLDRLVAEAIERFDLATPDRSADPEDGYLYVDPRHVTIDTEDVHFAGTMRVEAEIDMADAIDLDRALAQGAATQAALGSTESLNARRAKALGDLSRTQTALDLHTMGTGTPAKAEAGDGDGLPVAREVVLHAHFDAHFDEGFDEGSDEGSDEHTVFGPTGRLEEGQRLVLLDQVRSWCSDSRTKVTIKPVIDLNTQLHTSTYEVSDRIREQVILRDRTCVFPWCTRPARRCDVDHIVPHDPEAETEGRQQPGPTQTDNLACLCRGHHRLKTHSAWRYEMVAPGVFEWTSPHGSATATTTTAPPRSTHPCDPTRGVRPASRDHADHDPAPHPVDLRSAGASARSEVTRTGSPELHGLLLTLENAVVRLLGTLDGERDRTREDLGQGSQPRRLEMGVVRDLDDGHGVTLRRTTSVRPARRLATCPGPPASPCSPPC